MSKYKFRIFVLFVFLLFPICVNAQVRNVSTNKSLILGDYETTLLNLVNQAREEAGVNKLVLDQGLVDASRQRAVEISVNYDSNHLRCDGSNWRSVISEFGVSGDRFGENIAYATYPMSPQQVFNMWIDSEAHRNNILNPEFTTLGLGIVKSTNGYTYWVQNFGNSLQTPYIPYIGYNEVPKSYNLRYEDSLAQDVYYEGIHDITLNVGEEFNIQQIIETINNSDYPEKVNLLLQDFVSSNPQNVEVNGTHLVALSAGSSVISTTFAENEISFNVNVLGEVDNDEKDGEIFIVNSMHDKDNPLKIDIKNNQNTYTIDEVSNVSVTYFGKDKEIINNNQLDVSICKDSNCSSMLKPIKYSSDDSSIVEYIQNELIFNKMGNANITAIFENGISVIIPVKVSYFKFEKNYYDIEVTDSINIPIISDFKNLIFSSDDESIVRGRMISSDEVEITGVGVGSTYINVYDEETKLFARALVTVNKKQISIKVDQDNAQLILGESLNLKVTVDPIDTIVTYSSSDESVATVDSDGKVSTVGVGDAVITITAAGEQKSVNISVINKEINPTILKVDKTSVLLYELETVKINATVSPIQTLSWYSDDNLVAEVDDDGVITAIRDGMTTIHVVSADGCEVLIDVVVKSKDIPISDIIVDKDKVVLVEGDTTSVLASVIPDNTTDNTELIWKSLNEDVAKVDESGNITAISQGEAIITVTSVNGVSKEIKVIVNKKLIPISSINVSKDNVILNRGESITISATINPDNTTDDKTLIWSSSNCDVAEVDNNGVITAKSSGVAVITVTAGGVSTSINVSVVVGITEITLNYNELTLRDEFNLTVSYSPSDAKFDMNKLTWTSSNLDVVIVKDGLLIPVGIGEAIIAVYYGDIYDECHIIIDEHTTIKPFGNIIDRKDPSNLIENVLVNDSIGLEFIINDELKILSTNDNYKIKWEVSNNLVIDQDGNVKFVKPGRAYVKVGYGMYSAIRYFNVYDIEINSYKDTIKVNEATNISAVVTTPETISNNVHYVLSDYTIASITSDGVLRGLKPGYVTITIYSIDRNVSRNITVRVISDNSGTNTPVPSKPSTGGWNGGSNVSRPSYVENDNNKTDDNSTDNEFVENKFELVFDESTFTIENKDGNVVVRCSDITGDESLSLSSNEELIALYDIYFESNASLLKDGLYTVKIPLKTNINQFTSIYVAYIKNGNIEEILDSSIEGNYIVFKTDHFSYYAIIGTKSKSGSMKEEDLDVVDNGNEDDGNLDNDNDNNKTNIIVFIAIFIIVWIILFSIINKLITTFSKKRKRH